jgi:membrane protease YdiL (CAAX protease family)
MRGRPTPAARQALGVFATELRGIVRDRRALFSAIVLPMLLYPLLLHGQRWLERVTEETLGARLVHVGVDLRRAGPEMETRMRELLQQESPIELLDVDASPLQEIEPEVVTGAPAAIDKERQRAARLFAQGLDALLVAIEIDVPPHLALRPYHDGAEDLSNEALRRIERARTTLHGELSRVKNDTLLVGGDPARALDELRVVDVASAGDQGGAALGRFLPLLAVFVLLSGGAYAALSAFAGEREAGTLETLLVQPVPARAIAAAKFAAVFLTALATLVCNSASIFACLALGIGSLPGLTGGADGAVLAVGAGRLALACVAFLPVALLLCALLCLVCGRARTFREGQYLLLPLLLVALVPTLLATQDDVALDLFTAAIPLAGPALAVRDVLRGEFAWAPFAWMFAAGAGWAALAITRVASVLDAEKVLSTRGDENEDARRAVQSQTALRWGLALVCANYLVGSTLQNWNPVVGLALTLLVLLPLFAWLSARGTARRARARVKDVLGLRAPRLAHVAGALLCAPALLLVSRALLEWQQRALPLPVSYGSTELLQTLEDLPLWGQVALFAIAAAAGEELFFRGALLGGLARDLGAWRCAAWQFVLFGAAHMSIYRFLPTGVIGALLTFVALRSRSIFPGLVLHASYNALIVLDPAQRTELAALADPRLAWLALPGVALLALVRPRPVAR